MKLSSVVFLLVELESKLERVFMTRSSKNPQITMKFMVW
jgi:hypothetical protein